MYLLDSDVVIDFLNGKEPGTTTVTDLLGKTINISIVSWAEIVFGIKKSRDPEARFKQFLEFLKTFVIQVIPIKENVANQYVTLKIELEKKREPLSDFDLLIASTAIIHKLILVTRNKKHFSRIRNLSLYDGS